MDDMVTVSKAAAEKVLDLAQLGMDSMDKDIRRMRQSAHLGNGGPILREAVVLRDQHHDAMTELHIATHGLPNDPDYDGVPF